MSIKLPLFKNTNCIIFTACGTIKTQDNSFKNLESKQKTMVYSYETAQGRGIIRILIGQKPEYHLHIDCALEKCFPKGKTPKKTHKKVELENFLKKYINSIIDTNIAGVFVFPLDELPSYGVIRSLSIEQKMLNMKVKLVGGKFLIEGAPVRNIDWEINEAHKEAVVRIESEMTEITIDDEYLNKLLNSINEIALLFVLGKNKDE